MKNKLVELCYSNINPQSDICNNTTEVKQLMEYMSRYHNELLKAIPEEQRDVSERFDNYWREHTTFAFFGKSRICFSTRGKNKA